MLGIEYNSLMDKKSIIFIYWLFSLKNHKSHKSFKHFFGLAIVFLVEYLIKTYYCKSKFCFNLIIFAYLISSFTQNYKTLTNYQIN